MISGIFRNIALPPPKNTVLGFNSEARVVLTNILLSFAALHIKINSSRIGLEAPLKGNMIIIIRTRGERQHFGLRPRGVTGKQNTL